MTKESTGTPGGVGKQTNAGAKEGAPGGARGHTEKGGSPSPTGAPAVVAEASGEQIDFTLEDVFPDAEAIFSFVPESLESVRNECYFVLDTNVLLKLYEVENTNLAVIRDTLTVLRDRHRLVVPARVAREFAKNRGGKIASLHEELRKQKQNLQSPPGIQYPLLKALPDYKKLSEARENLKGAIEQYQKSIEAVLEEIVQWRWRDPVGQLYRDLFGRGVVRETKLDRPALQREWPQRRAKGLPPGYKDKQPGDLIIWRTILDLATEKKPVAFVCGDEKADWRVQDEAAEKSARAKLYPRYELMEEFRRASGGRTFYLLRLSEMLKLLGAPSAAVDDVREVESRSSGASNGYIPEPVASIRVIARTYVNRLIGRREVGFRLQRPQYAVRLVGSNVAFLPWRGNIDAMAWFANPLNQARLSEDVIDAKKKYRLSAFHLVFVCDPDEREALGAGLGPILAQRVPAVVPHFVDAIL